MVLRYIDNNPAKGKIPSTWHIPLLHTQKTKIWLKRAFAAHDTATHHAASTASIYNFPSPQLQLQLQLQLHLISTSSNHNTNTNHPPCRPQSMMRQLTLTQSPNLWKIRKVLYIPKNATLPPLWNWHHPDKKTIWPTRKPNNYKDQWNKSYPRWFQSQTTFTSFQLFDNCITKSQPWYYRNFK